MKSSIMQEVAFLFVEQYEKLVEPYKDSEVALIRATAEKGEAAMYMVVASIFGPSLDQALLGAAHGGMDYIAYYDETWDEMDEQEKADVEELADFHLESVRAILHLSRLNECSTTEGIIQECKKAEYYTRRLHERMAAEKQS